MNGIINVYKEAGYTSFDVVAKLRGILKTKKIGHTGTLDPDAVGVLPVCVGNATRVVELLTDRTKEYVAVMRLGVVTDTQDMTGKILSEDYESAGKLSDSTIREAIHSFEGEIEQIPPMYSALKVNGQKLVDLARKGIEVERKPRKVTIFELEVLDADSENASDLHEGEKENGKDYAIRVVCSKGTYIRTLIHDIGQKLGCGAAMVHLERTRVGEFNKDTALLLEKIQETMDKAGEQEKKDGHFDFLIPVDIMFEKYPALRVLENGMKALSNGNQLQPEMLESMLSLDDCDKNIELCKPKLKAKQVYRIYSYDNRFCALYEYHSGYKVLTPVKMFLS